jgi:hypothetical protein
MSEITSSTRMISDKGTLREYRCRAIAPLVLLGKKATEIAKEFETLTDPNLNSLKYQTILQLLKSAEYEAIMKEITSGEMALTLTEAKSALGKLVPKAVRVLEKAMEEGDHSEALQAARMVFRSVGLEQGEKDAGDQNITILLPGAEQPTTIEVKNEDNI